MIFDLGVPVRNSGAMVWSEQIIVMLLTHEKLQQFTSKQIIDAKKSIGVINGLSMESPEEMNKITNNAITKGGVELDELKDYGFMQYRSFEDLDGNQWEVMYMDMSRMPG